MVHVSAWIAFLPVGLLLNFKAAAREKDHSHFAREVCAPSHRDVAFLLCDDG